MENTSNASFLRQTYADRKDINRLIQPPIITEAPSRRSRTPGRSEGGDRREFRNEPLIDFSRRENRERFGETLQRVREQFNGHADERIDRQTLESLNPANPAEINGRVRIACILYTSPRPRD